MSHIGESNRGRGGKITDFIGLKNPTREMSNGRTKPLGGRVEKIPRMGMPRVLFRTERRGRAAANRCDGSLRRLRAGSSYPMHSECYAVLREEMDGTKNNTPEQIGKKLYAKRNKEGQFTDIQSYIKRRSKKNNPR
jgi:hypothetical protein